jgi:hypothetical protein
LFSWREGVYLASLRDVQLIQVYLMIKTRMCQQRVEHGASKYAFVFPKMGWHKFSHIFLC